MRKLGLVLAFVGAFLLVAGVCAQLFAPGALKKVPLNVDSQTRLSGKATVGDEEGNVNVFVATRINSEKSDDEVAAWTNSTCVVWDRPDESGEENDSCVSENDPEKRLINTTSDTFATDRVDALAVNSPKYADAVSGERHGLMNKWPFDAQKKTYPYWDGTLGAAAEAKFVKEDKLENGLKVYVYQVDIDRTRVADVGGGAEGYYEGHVTVTIEPTTGAPVIQRQIQKRWTLDGDPVIDLDVEFTDAQKKKSADETKEQASGLKLITKTVPLLGFAVGLPLLIIGGALVLLVGRGGAGTRKADGAQAPALEDQTS